MSLTPVPDAESYRERVIAGRRRLRARYGTQLDELVRSFPKPTPDQVELLRKIIPPPTPEMVSEVLARRYPESLPQAA